MHPLQAMASFAMSNLLFIGHDFESAMRMSEAALGAARRMSLMPLVFRCCLSYGDALFSVGRSREAAPIYFEARSVHESLLARMTPAQKQIYRSNPEIQRGLEGIRARSV